MMSQMLSVQAGKLGQAFGMSADGEELVEVLKATAFKGQVTDAQMAALMVVANQYKLNPFTREIYAFPDKGGIVPVVGVDGWARIMNEHPAFDGIQFDDGPDYCTAIVYRKDRGHPVSVTEYMVECRRETGPWKSHPRRMLRHKAMIQAVRLAFGFTGIYDPDEAERIREARNAGAIDAEIVQPAAIVHRQPAQRTQQARPEYDQAKFDAMLPRWADGIASGKMTADSVIAKVASAYTVTQEQRAALREIEQRAADEEQAKQQAQAQASSDWLADFDGGAA
jgi:phage recombination protein Bet